MKIPHSETAERAILGQCMIGGLDLLAQVASLVAAEDFYREAHRNIFAVMLGMMNKGEPVEMVSVAQEVSACGLEDACGGVAYVCALPEEVPSVENFGHYCGIVRAMKVRRDLLDASRETAEAAQDMTIEATEALDRSASRVLAIDGEGSQAGGWVSAGAAVSEALDRVHAIIDRGDAIEISTGFAELDRVLAGLHRTDLVILAARPAMGKCLSADTDVILSTGEVVTIEDLYHRKDAGLMALGADYRLRPAKASDFIDSGVKPIVEVETASGRKVRTTWSHLYLTIDGWRKVDELEIGTEIAVPRTLPVFGSTPIGSHRAKLLAYLIADGGLSRACPMFTNNSAVIQADFARAVEAFGGAEVVEAGAKDRARTVRVRGKGGTNTVTAWLREVGLMGHKAAGKFIPACVFTAPVDEVALFLNRLFATDGWVYSGNTSTEIGYCSMSERLVRQVAHLLLRFGILARVRSKHVKYKEGRTAWVLKVTDRDSVFAFADEIGVFEKGESLRDLCERFRARKPHSNVDYLPMGAWALVEGAKGGQSWSALARSVGVSRLHHGRSRMSRELARKIARYLGIPKLLNLAESDVLWDPIVRITERQPEQVYDLTVPVHHNFVASDVYCHNTALALNIAANVAQQGHSVGIFSLEMSAGQLVTRLMVSESRVFAGKVRTGDLDQRDLDRLTMAATTVHDWPIEIDDTPGLSITKIRARARRLRAMHPDLALIVVDYIGLLQGEGKEGRQQQIADASRGLKILAKELGVCCLALSQLNRNCEHRKPPIPQLSDLRESGAIEQDADVIMFIYRDEYYQPETTTRPGEADVIVAKQRNGPTKTVALAFDGPLTQFSDLDRPAGGVFPAMP